LLIYTDDHRFSDVHCLGGQAVRTPNLDRLRDEGIAFRHAYLMGSFSGATCIPSRATLLSGRHLFALHDTGHSIPPEHTTIGEAFRRAGYHSHIVGKWHQDKKSLARSFDDGDALMGVGGYLTDKYRMPLLDWDPTGQFSRDKAYLLQYDSEGRVIRRPVSPEDKRGPIGTEETGPHCSQIFADNAVRFIRNYHEARPFFMYLAFPSPHDPRQAPREYQALYPPEKIQLPPSYMPQHPFDNGHMVLRDEELAPWPRTPEVVRQHLADYYALTTYLDTQIGRVIQALRDSGAWEHTLVVMAGDSGLAVGNHGLMGKQNIYDEDGVHVPFLLSGGVIQDRARDIDALCYIHDIFPTICDLAGVPIPESVTGKSLLPVINHQQEQIRDHTYHAYRQFQRAYRKDGYKLIEYVRAPDKDKTRGTFIAGSRVTQLFNVQEDPWETTDLSWRPEQQERVQAMRAALRAEARALGDNNATTGEPYDFWDHFE